MCSPSVPVGEYVLEVQASGFKLERRSRIKFDVNQNARVAVGSRTGTVAP
jgi:hypothetical protein